jgi:predicted kinase
VRARLLASAARHADQLRARARRGRFVDGHGDLRLEHVAMTGHGLVVLDCVEFSAALRQIDRLSDAAFLAMDLCAKGEPALSLGFESAYLLAAGEEPEETVSLRALYRAYRAYVRAAVDVHTASDVGIDANVRGLKASAAQRNLALCWTETRQGLPGAVVLLRGRSGTGKSMLASQLAAPLRAQVLRSDEIRKELLGWAPTRRPSAAEREWVYGAELSTRTYATLLARAEAHAAAGEAVLLDATWLQAGGRAQAGALARRLGAPLAIVDLWCEPEEVRRRLAQRAREGQDASDADWEIHLRQAAEEEPLDTAEQERSVAHHSGDGTGPLLMALLERLEAACLPGPA